MYYFIHGVNIAVAETAEQAAKYAAADWRPVSRATFIAAWRARDAQVLAEQRRVTTAVLVERARVAGVPVELLGHWQ